MELVVQGSPIGVALLAPIGRNAIVTVLVEALLQHVLQSLNLRTVLALNFLVISLNVWKFVIDVTFLVGDHHLLLSAIDGFHFHLGLDLPLPILVLLEFFRLNALALRRHLLVQLVAVVEPVLLLGGVSLPLLLSGPLRVLRLRVNLSLHRHRLLNGR